MVPLQSLVERNTHPAGKDKYPVLSITAGVGFVNQAVKFGKEIAGAQYVHYTVLKKGDFSYNKGNSRLYPQGCIYRQDKYENAAVPNVFNSFHFVSPEANPDYYKYLFESGYLNQQLYRLINSGVRDNGLLNLYDDDFYSCNVPCPPLAEQKRIAEILGCCDRMIALKKELIAEKKKQKKALMQKLLNPDSGFRLPGFDGEWERARIKNLSQVQTGATPSTANSDFWGGDIPWMTSGELNQKHVFDVLGRITRQGLNNLGKKLLPPNCVLIGLAGQGKTRGTVAINHIALCTNQSIAAILPSNRICPEFLYQNLDSRYNELRKISSGDGLRGGLNIDLIKNIYIQFPSFKEQQAIADILSAADREIDLLEKELAQQEQKKRSLMQMLLTGIIKTYR